MHTKVSFITRCVGQGFESYLLLFQKSVYLCNISEQSTLWWTTLSTRIYVESNYMQPPKTKRDECSSHAIDPAFTAALLPLVNHLLQGPGKADPPPSPLMKHRAMSSTKTVLWRPQVMRSWGSARRWLEVLSFTHTPSPPPVLVHSGRGSRMSIWVGCDRGDMKRPFNSFHAVENAPLQWAPCLLHFYILGPQLWGLSKNSVCEQDMPQWLL